MTSKIMADAPNKVISHYFEDHGLIDEIDPKKYKIEQDEVNELFRLSQQNNGGICT